MINSTERAIFATVGAVLAVDAIFNLSGIAGFNTEKFGESGLTVSSAYELFFASLFGLGALKKA